MLQGFKCWDQTGYSSRVFGIYTLDFQILKAAPPRIVYRFHSVSLTGQIFRHLICLRDLYHHVHFPEHGLPWPERKPLGLLGNLHW